MRSRSFDHHYAIYYLFAERLRSRDALQSAQQQALRQSSLTPSDVAEQREEASPSGEDHEEKSTTEEESVPLWQALPRPPDIRISTVESMDIDLTPGGPGIQRPRGRASTSTLPRASVYDNSPCVDPSGTTPTRSLEEASAAMLPCFTIGRRSSDGAALHREAVAFRQRLQPLQVHAARTFTSSVIAEEPLDPPTSPMDVT